MQSHVCGKVSVERGDRRLCLFQFTAKSVHLENQPQEIFKHISLFIAYKIFCV